MEQDKRGWDGMRWGGMGARIDGMIDGKLDGSQNEVRKQRRNEVFKEVRNEVRNDQSTAVPNPGRSRSVTLRTYETVYKSPLEILPSARYDVISARQTGPGAGGGGRAVGGGGALYILIEYV